MAVARIGRASNVEGVSTGVCTQVTVETDIVAGTSSGSGKTVKGHCSSVSCTLVGNTNVGDGAEIGSVNRSCDHINVIRQLKRFDVLHIGQLGSDGNQLSTVSRQRIDTVTAINLVGVGEVCTELEAIIATAASDGVVCSMLAQSPADRCNRWHQWSWQWSSHGANRQGQVAGTSANSNLGNRGVVGSQGHVAGQTGHGDSNGFNTSGVKLLLS